MLSARFNTEVSLPENYTAASTVPDINFFFTFHFVDCLIYTLRVSSVFYCVYSAVRTGSLNKAVCASSLKGLYCKNCTLCPHCIYVFCVYLRTNSDLCHLQHKLIGFYNRDEKCLQRGTDWVFK